jgi:protein SCO1/2
MRKAIVFVVLGIPVLIAIILKLFGQNQFEIPVYYEEGVSSEECDTELKGQYYVGDFQTIDGRNHSLKGEISIVYFHSAQNEHVVQMTRDFERAFSTKSGSSSFKVYAFTDIDNVFENIPDLPITKTLHFDSDQLDSIARCSLFLSQSDIDKGGLYFSTIILMDRSGRIRGYYDGSEEEEYDRLSAEVDILQLEDDEDK